MSELRDVIEAELIVLRRPVDIIMDADIEILAARIVAAIQKEFCVPYRAPMTPKEFEEHLEGMYSRSTKSSGFDGTSLSAYRYLYTQYECLCGIIEGDARQRRTNAQ